MRVLTPAIAAITSLAAASAVTGLLIARRLTAPPARRSFDLTVKELIRDGSGVAVVLDRNATTAARGIYNLWLADGGWVRVGSILREEPATVTRRVDAVMPNNSLRAGIRASWSGIFFRDPDDAGLAAEDVLVSTTSGTCPAWLIRAGEDGDADWAIHIHGLASPRAGTLRGVRVATELGLTSLVVTYRNDGEGPTVGEGRSTLGALETDDVRAAVRFAFDHGARRIVLFGWSMGAAIALQLATDAQLDGVVDAVVIDSPVLDWTATIDANCARAGLPSWFGILARPWLCSRVLARVLGLGAPIPLHRFDWIERANDISVPTLILHGSRDRSAPIEMARQLAELRPDQVRLETFESDHTMGWNSDPQRWAAVVGEWLTDRLSAGRRDMPDNNGP